MKPVRYLFPVLMCALTVATAAQYAIVSRVGREYNFVVKTDAEGFSRIQADLEAAELQGVAGEEVEEGVFRITVRCPTNKLNTLWRILGRDPVTRSKK